MKQPHKHATLIKAWADGAEIEVWMEYSGIWRTVCNPVWASDREYRIKHTPVIVKKYTFFDRIEKYVKEEGNLNRMMSQIWYDDLGNTGDMLEWTFTDGKLTKIEIKHATN